MNNFRRKLKRRAFKKTILIKEAVNIFIQPYKELPSMTDMGAIDTDRINAYDLFSFYTADIIKEDIVFIR